MSVEFTDHAEPVVNAAMARLPLTWVEVEDADAPVAVPQTVMDAATASYLNRLRAEEGERLLAQAAGRAQELTEAYDEIARLTGLNSALKNKVAELEEKLASRGGARVGSGRPKGSTTKIRIEDLMAQIELQSGETYDQLLAKNYVSAIARSDWGGVRDYDKAFMNKMIADKQEVTTVESTEAIEQKQAAFAEAIRQITGITTKN